MTRLKVACSALLASAGIAGAAIAIGGPSATATGSQSAADVSVGSFAVLRAPDNTDAATKSRVERVIPARLTTAPTTAVRSVLDIPGLRGFVIAKGQVICLYLIADTSSSTACGEASKASDGAHPIVTRGLVGENRWRVTALLPDGISSATLTTSTGESISAKAQNNIVTITASGEPRQLTWTSTDAAANSIAFTPAA